MVNERLRGLGHATVLPHAPLDRLGASKPRRGYPSTDEYMGSVPPRVSHDQLQSKGELRVTDRRLWIILAIAAIAILGWVVFLR